MELQAGDLQNSMADSSTTVRGIPIRFVGGYWARRQLHAGIRYVPVASKLMKSLSSIEEVLGSALEILLDGRFLHNRYRYSNSDCGRLLGLTSASRRYRVRPYAMKTHEVSLCAEGGAGSGVEGVWWELETLYIYKLVLVELALEWKTI